MELNYSKIFNKKTIQSVLSFCELNKIDDTDKFFKKCLNFLLSELIIYIMQAYTAVPQGALVNIPEALPQGLLYRYKRI